MAEVTIDQFVDKEFKRLDQAIRKIKIEVFTVVLVSTRVDTGRLAGNWQITNVAPAGGELDRLDPTYAGGMARIRSVSGVEEPSFMVNNLDYAWVWNQVDGYVDRARAHFPTAVARHAR